MHVPILKRAPANQVIGFAIVLAIFVSTVLAVAALDRVSDDDAPIAQPNAQSSGPAREANFAPLPERQAALRGGVAQNAEPAGQFQSQFHDMQFGQVLVDQMHADQRAAHAAMERIVMSRRHQ